MDRYPWPQARVNMEIRTRQCDRSGPPTSRSGLGFALTAIPIVPQTRSFRGAIFRQKCFAALMVSALTVTKALFSQFLDEASA